MTVMVSESSETQKWGNNSSEGNNGKNLVVFIFIWVGPFLNTNDDFVTHENGLGRVGWDF